MTTAPDPYHGFRFRAEVIEHAVWLYHCFSRSLRDVETILAARGVVVSYRASASGALLHGPVPWRVGRTGHRGLHPDVTQADILVSMKLTASQDREAVGRWIQGQADRAEGRRILAALPRLAQGEGWVWAPTDGVLERVAFPTHRHLRQLGNASNGRSAALQRRQVGWRRRTCTPSGRRWAGDKGHRPVSTATPFRC